MMTWGWLYAHLMQSLHLPRREIDALHWADVAGLFDYWREHPPSHMLLAGFVGYQPPAETAPDEVLRPDQLAALLQRPMGSF